MHFDGIIAGLATFLIIGLFHPIVIKGEYHFGTSIWPVFFAVGILCCVLSLFAGNNTARVILSVIGFSSFWSILEVFQQRERVRKGWFPKKKR